ncbi:Baeyer-Villiger monooxygenase, partial [Pseudocercospora fuligena]
FPPRIAVLARSMMTNTQDVNGASSATTLDVLVIGGGFGGCYMLKLLRENGFETKLIDAAPRLGGVWAWNRYPGARVDVEMPCYSFSDPAVLNTYTWTERYPSDLDLRRYFDHVDQIWNLSKDVEFDTQVTECVYDEHSGSPRWIVRTKNGRVYDCKWVISATGTSFKQYIPDWQDMSEFKGVIGHSSLWPDNVDLSGKRVGIIGAGSTALQVMQEAAKVASNVTQFIRTPNLALPMRQRKVSEEEIDAYRPQFPHLMKSLRSTPAALPTVGNPRRTFDVSDEERRAIWEEGWKRGGFNWSIGGFSDTLLDREANKEAYKFWREKTLPRMQNKQKASLLIPEEMPYWIGTKRPSLEQDYYECCDRPKVEITNSPIVRFTETGVVAEDGERSFEVVVVATGYDAVTGGLRTMGVIGKDGIALDHKWNAGISTHLGMMVNGFPNFYMIYGPQSPTSLSNGPPFLELQVEWIIDVLRKQREERLDAVEAKQSEEDKWRQQTHDLANATLAVETNSWYMGANVPGKRREFLIYMGGVPTWHKACIDALEDWKGFDTSATSRL